MQFSQDLTDKREYKQVLPQMNFYIGQHNARYEFVLSGVEHIAIKRHNWNGHLAVTTPVLWRKRGCWTPFGVVDYGIS